MPRVNHVYFDSCVFLAYFNGEPGRVDLLDQLFEQIHQDQERLIVTSAYSIIEVVYVVEEKRKSRLLEGIEEKFDKFWATLH